MTKLSRNLLVVALTGFAGCGPPGTSVQGTVSYEGEPVQRGVITLTPTDGSGKPEGSKILAGRFEIDSIEPGKKQLSVIGVTGKQADINKPTTSEDKTGTIVAAAHSAEMIPTNAMGNGQTITLAEGNQEITLRLTRPSDSK